MQLKLSLTERFIVWRVLYRGSEIDYNQICPAVNYVALVGGELAPVWKERRI